MRNALTLTLAAISIASAAVIAFQGCRQAPAPVACPVAVPDASAVDAPASVTPAADATPCC